MPNRPLDLAKTADFALATGSSVATVAQLFGRDPAEWDIEEASFNGVPFHVFKSKVPWGGALPSIRDKGGRRLVQYQFPYRDGQTTDDLGRSPESFDIEAVLFGEGYTNGLRLLFAELQSPRPGLLVHPVRGVVECKMDTYELTHSHEMRRAVQIRITFVEHNFTLASYGKIATIKNFKSLLSDVLAVFNAIQTAVNKVRAAINIINTIKNEITVLYAAYQAAFAETAVSINSVFNRGESFDIPALLPVNQGGIFGPDGELISERFPSAINPADPYRNVPTTQIRAAISANEALYASQQFESLGALEGTTDPEQTAATIGLQAIASVSAAVASIVVQNKINSTRILAENLIQHLSAITFEFPRFAELGTDSDGSLEFNNEIMDLRRSVILLQNAYELGAEQTGIGIRRVVAQRTQSIRELAFAQGIDPERSLEIDLLNPELLSTNLIAAGTEVYLPL